MKRLLTLVAAVSMLALAAAPPALADFGLKDLDVRFENADGSIAPQAGAHPFAMTTTLAFNTRFSETAGFEVPDGDPKDLMIPQMEGLVGNPRAVPTCSNAEFVTGSKNCPVGSQIGINYVTFSSPDERRASAVYSLDPPPGVAMKLGFYVLLVPVTVELRVNESFPANVVASLSNISNVVPVYRSELKLWGVPADKAHDSERGGSVNLSAEPFLTTPRACTGPLETRFKARSWQDEGTWWEGATVTHDDAEPPNPQGMIGCGQLGFNPSITAQPTSKAAGSPTGLNFSLDVKDEGLTNPVGIANSDIRKTVVTLPEGFSINPSIAEGLEVCSEDQVARETAVSAPGAGCPDAAKIGTVEVETPLLEGEVLNGSLFQATPYENPFGNLVSLYMVIKSPELGIKIVQPLKVTTDPRTGRITTVADDLPQLPFSHFRLRFREGTRSPLATPPSCGIHTVEAQLYPWAGGPPRTSTSAFEVITGPDGGPCPSGDEPPFRPGLLAGTVNNAAGSYSPFNLRLSRNDGEQEFTRFSIKLPPGIVAKLAGVPYCPEAGIAAAKARTGPHGGAEELAAPSCPAASEIGRTLVGAGVGPSLAYAPGKIYLAGPYNGSALSIVAITAAKVGPFDLGTVVIREAIEINSETAEVFIDSTGSDPIPHIIKGIPVHARDIRAYVDRPQFVINPTNCSRTSTASTVLGSGTDFGSDSDDNPFTVTSPFQAADCAALGFKPKLRLFLKGGTKRAKNPALKAVLTARPGDANIGRAQVTLPKSAFLEQGHIRTICTRVQFNAGEGNGAGCPAESVYGTARAITPILSEPVEGPVFLRANGGERELPDLVAALHSGQIDFNLVGYIDSNGKGQIRNTFATPPDVPVQSFTLNLYGGKKSLIANSVNLCLRKNRALADFTGQNGKRYTFKPVVKPSCKKGKGGKKGKARRLARGRS